MKANAKQYLGRLAVVRVLTVVLVLIGCESALAHARLLRSNPKPDSELTQTPIKIELWFNELLDDGFNSISVSSINATDPNGSKNLAERDARVDSDDRTHLSVAVKTLPPGDYAVDWEVLSLDGHTARGRFKFIVGGAK
jgi:methionine-rich copper-binding protein CopC